MVKWNEEEGGVTLLRCGCQEVHMIPSNVTDEKDASILPSSRRESQRD